MGIRSSADGARSSLVCPSRRCPLPVCRIPPHWHRSNVSHPLAIPPGYVGVVTNKAVEDLYTPEEKDILQVDYMWHAWDNSQMHRIAPQIDEMLQIWQEELSASQ